MCCMCITFLGNDDNDKRIVCYVTSWAFYRKGDGKFVPENIDTRLCTHIVYAYASLSYDELVAKEFDPWADITNSKKFSLSIISTYS